MENDSRIVALNEKFAIDGVARIARGNGGLPCVLIETSTAAAQIYLHGAQITSWRPAGSEEVIFLSGRSHWTEGRAIRGGIPVCFPWFRAKADDPNAPSHGFVRTKEWQLESILAGDGDSVSVHFSTGSDDGSRKWWPFEFRLEYSITVGKRLELELTMKNTGDRELKFEEALHTYFKVGDARRARVSGLEGVTFLDNRDGNQEKMQREEFVLSRQTDNAYRITSGPVEIVDEVLGRRLRTVKVNSASTIVWNPWNDGAAAMADFEANEWTMMLCVEGGNIMDSAVTLMPGETHTMAIMIEATGGKGK